jgi:hypothetical protein
MVPTGRRPTSLASDDLERRLADAPAIAESTIALGATLTARRPWTPARRPLDGGAYAGKFAGKYAHRVIEGGIGATCRTRLRRLCKSRRPRRRLLTGVCPRTGERSDD